MQITAEIENSLGEARIVVSQGRQAAITSGSWAILLSDAEKYIDPEIVAFAKQQAQRDPQECVDYRALNAREFVGDRFLPATGKELQPILLSRTWSASIDYEKVESLIEDHKYAFEGEDLSKVFDSGKAEPVYEPSSVGGIKRIISGSHQASSYIFRVGSKIINIDGNLLRGVCDAGFSVILNTEFYPTSGAILPALGLLDKEDRGVVGILMPLKACGVMKDADERPLYYDASTVCWVSPAQAEEMIKSDTSFFDPEVASIADDLTLDERAKGRRHGDAIKGISALRWHGASDHEIEKIVNYASYDAWCQLYHQALKTASGLLDRADVFSKETEEITTNAAHTIRYFSRQTKSICKRIESLSRLMESKGGEGYLGFGPLPDLVDIVTDLEELCDS